MFVRVAQHTYSLVVAVVLSKGNLVQDIRDLLLQGPQIQGGIVTQRQQLCLNRWDRGGVGGAAVGWEGQGRGGNDRSGMGGVR